MRSSIISKKHDKGTIWWKDNMIIIIISKLEIIENQKYCYQKKMLYAATF